jgi:hypothetical protein
MDIETATKILGINRTKDGDLKPMVKALELFSALNSPEENERLEAAKYVLRRWKKYQDHCNEKRNINWSKAWMN